MTPTNVLPEARRIDQAVETLKLVADGVRFRILWALLEGERSVSDLAETVQSPPSTVSRHLSKLRLGQLVTHRREGTSVFYSLADGHLGSLVKEAVFHTGHIGSPTAPD
ncbi:transcriptional regulator, ArsR family [Euzebya pacifica]|uniref:Transcriptional regulator, ArsR family n=1 Tax=Euzebya pacifica TaxID=1608957 RepID=A0A346Y177_9ACTN|nr:metalloregulator ArsR/SmtB family transcription factor [Euzebya pacifica]AXV08224.1 transcriptional regulator, ArsR family [Euzebya pacifica]